MNSQISGSPTSRWFTRAKPGFGLARRWRPAVTRTAIGYVRTDLAGLSRPNCESLITTSANNLGYDLLGTLTFTGCPVTRLHTLVTELAVDAVLCPTFAHLDGEVPTELLTATTVVIIEPPIVYSQWDPIYR
ncbi:hypothetical protein [Nocardia asteroides]|uniref:hypothetical protein n=1 Tax=Nocardia asteroides TaxID=1824 RepID=UPI0033EC08D4